MQTSAFFDLQSERPEHPLSPPADPQPEPLFEPFPEPNTIPRGWDTSEMK